MNNLRIIMYIIIVIIYICQILLIDHECLLNNLDIYFTTSFEKVLEYICNHILNYCIFSISVSPNYSLAEIEPEFSSKSLIEMGWDIVLWNFEGCSYHIYISSLHIIGSLNFPEYISNIQHGTNGHKEGKWNLYFNSYHNGNII